MKAKFSKIGRRGKIVLAVLIAAMFIGVATAALLPHYGKITTTVDVEQSVTLDGKSMPASGEITDEINGVAGDLILGDNHLLTNNADKKIVIDLDDYKETKWPQSGHGGLKTAYPEYHLDATVDDDAFYVTLSGNIIWENFNSASFDYLMDSDGGNLWIPQMNIVLRDDQGEGQYYAAWHSFRTGITGVVGERTSMTYEKGDFYIYELPSWALIGLWDGITDQDLIDKINLLQFSYFTRQAGDTSIDPDNPPVAEQKVWLSNFATSPSRDITGIGLPASSQGTVLQNLWFRMLYIFEDMAYPGIYEVETKVNYIGTL